MSDNLEVGASSREIIKDKLRQNFDGKIVRKDLTKKIKEGANVPVYVLEFLLGQYCSSDDEEVIEQGVQNVKRILADNFVRPDEAQKILSRLRSRGSHTIIDMVTVRLDIKKDCFFAEFSNLGLSNIPIVDEYPEKYDRLLCGGIWCIVQLDYETEGDNNFGIIDSKENTTPSKQKKQKDISPINIRKLTPIQMPHIDIEDLKRGRKAFTKEEWLDVMMRSIGMEPDELTYREKWLLLTRMIPLVENNFNLCELGPRSTGKSHLYKEISPNSILVSGGQTTVANLFYNMGRKTVGLVGLWDCVAFDEVAGIRFKDKDGVQIMKDYMASGSFARGKEEKAASASMVFVGNINQSVDVLLKTSSLFDPFPPEMGTDTAFLDRIHCYLPGWEIPKFRPEHFTNDYGFICLQGLKNLLFANLSDNWIAVLFTFAFGVLFANLFLSYLPRFDVELHEENSLLWLLKRILFPVYIIHMVILYGYIAKIAYLQEMPIGVMNGYALFATVFYALFYFSLHRENNDRIRMLLRIGGALMIPIFIVQAVGLYIRIFSYGLTSMRYISIACMIFGICVAISGIFGIFARKLLPAAIVIVLFSTLTPLNLIDVPAYDQGMRLKFVVEKYGIVKNGTVSVPMNITSEDEKILKSSFSYLSGNEGAWRFPCVKTLSESAPFHEFIYSEKEDGKLNLTHTWNTISVSGYNRMYMFDEYLKNNVLSIETESGTYNVDINKYLEEADKVKNKNIEERMIYKVDEKHVLYFSDVYVDKSEDIKIHVSGFLLEKQLEAL